MREPHGLLISGVAYAALFISHLRLLKLPYYWDEAGYFVPAALDLHRHGWLIPRTTLANGHPPLLSLWLAAAWRVAGVAPWTTRAAMLGFAALLLVGVFRLGVLAFGRRTGAAAALLLAFVPLVFAQSALAQLDVPVAALVVWALVFRARRWLVRYAVAASAACLAKESAVLVPVVLCAADLLWPGHGEARRERLSFIAADVTPLVILALWFGYYHARTGYWMGNPQFMSYNLSQAFVPARLAIALLLRLWHLLAYEGMGVVVMAAAWRWLRTRSARVGNGMRSEPRDTTTRLRAEMVLVIAVYVVFHALVGGAVLARYLIPAIALLVIVVAAGLTQLPRAGWIVPAACAWLALNWFWNPPYAFPYEDNLAWTTFVRLHQAAAKRIEDAEQKWPVLTAWPATDELRNRDLGYVTHPVIVSEVEDFSARSLAAAHSGYHSVLLYSREYQPAVNWAEGTGFWARWKTRYFGHQPQKSEAELLRALELRTWFRISDGGQWVDVAEPARTPETRAGDPLRSAGELLKQKINVQGDD